VKSGQYVLFRQSTQCRHVIGGVELPMSSAPPEEWKGVDRCVRRRFVLFYLYSPEHLCSDQIVGFVEVMIWMAKVSR